jgi:hypothetical protein
MGLGSKIRKQVAKYDPITLEQMENVRLMRRTDTKFVFCKEKLPNILKLARENYFMVEIENEREQIYETIYFDTADYEMYRIHHNGKLNRFKVRIRKYIYSKMQFLEVKAKNNKGETIKKRIPCTEADERLETEETGAFLKKYTPFDQENLIPKLGNKFIRLTLVNRDLSERITLDYKLRFDDLTFNGKVKTSNVCIAEIKKSRDNKHSKFIEILREERVQSMGFSKYSVGMALLNPEIKKNGFKERIRKIEKINKLA